jgi:hypothetical protein
VSAVVNLGASLVGILKEVVGPAQDFFSGGDEVLLISCKVSECYERTFFFPSHTSGTYLSDDSLVITRSCTITKLRLLLIQSLTDLTQTLTDAHSASLQIAY